MKTGLKDTCFYLKPGEKIRTSSVLVMGYSEVEDKYNKFRALIKNHFFVKPAKKFDKNVQNDSNAVLLSIIGANGSCE